MSVFCMSVVDSSVMNTSTFLLDSTYMTHKHLQIAACIWRVLGCMCVCVLPDPSFYPRFLSHDMTRPRDAIINFGSQLHCSVGRLAAAGTRR